VTGSAATKLWDMSELRVQQLGLGGHWTARIFEAMKHMQEELDPIVLCSGIVIQEKIGDHAIDMAVEHLAADPTFKKLDEFELRKFVEYFVENNAASVVFAPEVISTFVDFARNVGFPVTEGGAKKAGLRAPRYSTSTLLRALVGAHVLKITEVRAKDVLDTKRSWEEDLEFKENPDKPVAVYELDTEFKRQLGHVLREMKFREESISKPEIAERLREMQEENLKPSLELDALEEQISKISAPAMSEKADPADTESDNEVSVFKQLDDDTVEKFIDGILIVLGELEQTGQINRIESPQQAKDAVLAAVRRMYQKRPLIAKMTSKYARFGAKRVLTKAKQKIGKSLSSKPKD